MAQKSQMESERGKQGAYDLSNPDEPSLGRVTDISDVSPTLAGAQTMKGVQSPAGDYKQEVRGSGWRVERTADREAIEEQLQAADEEAAKANAFREKQDPDYKPSSAEKEDDDQAEYRLDKEEIEDYIEDE